MKLTATQLRRIIKEEVQLCVLRNVVREALVGNADRRMSGGGIETAMSAGRNQTSKDVEIANTKDAIADLKRQIKKAESRKSRDLPLMQAELVRLQDELKTLKGQ